jgi:hypothetical protein
MSRLGSHLTLSAQARRHFFDKMGRGRYLGLFALGNVEPGAGERGLDFRSVHHAFSLLSGIGLARYGKPTDRKGEPMNGSRSLRLNPLFDGEKQQKPAFGRKWDQEFWGDCHRASGPSGLLSCGPVFVSFLFFCRSILIGQDLFVEFQLFDQHIDFLDANATANDQAEARSLR